MHRWALKPQGYLSKDAIINQLLSLPDTNRQLPFPVTFQIIFFRSHFYVRGDDVMFICSAMKQKLARRIWENQGSLPSGVIVCT